jgi:hypothetical protein
MKILHFSAINHKCSPLDLFPLKLYPFPLSLPPGEERWIASTLGMERLYGSEKRMGKLSTFFGATVLKNNINFMK